LGDGEEESGGGVMKITCKKCGKKEELHWIKQENDKLIARNFCFRCNFWFEKTLIKDNPNVARIDNHHYQIASEKSDSAFRGFAGAKFIILFYDGRKITTTNLWHQGEIPKRFKTQLRNNAKFLSLEGE